MSKSQGSVPKRSREFWNEDLSRNQNSFLNENFRNFTFEVFKSITLVREASK